MFPVDGLAPKPVVGNLEVPSRTDKREESFFGTTTIGSTTSPVPVLVYVYGGDTYIRYYGFATKRYIVTNLSGLDLKKYTINFGGTDGSHWIENILAAQLKFREAV